MNIPGTLRRNDIEPEELAAIAVYLHTEHQTFSWSETIGKSKKAKNPNVNANRFFNRPEIARYLDDYKYKIETEKNKIADLQKREGNDLGINSEEIDPDINSDNIKQILQSEFRNVKDPDKRAVILMKIADFIGLKNSDADDPTTPTIYLPARCKQCTLKK